jgi:hypothetical protein
MWSKTMIYQFKNGSHLAGDAQTIGERLGEIESASGGLTPEAVVRDARSAASVLHPLFEWNDARAADQWRLEQARYLIRSVIVVVEPSEPAEDQRTIRAFVPISGTEENRTYVPTLRALSDPGMRKHIPNSAPSRASTAN